VASRLPGRTACNLPSAAGPERLREAYPAAPYERLATIEATWDPNTVFALIQNTTLAR